MNETKLKAHGEYCHVWAAIDVETRELLAMRFSWARDIFDAKLLLEDH